MHKGTLFGVFVRYDYSLFSPVSLTSLRFVVMRVACPLTGLNEKRDHDRPAHFSSKVNFGFEAPSQAESRIEPLEKTVAELREQLFNVLAKQAAVDARISAVLNPEESPKILTAQDTVRDWLTRNTKDRTVEKKNPPESPDSFVVEVDKSQTTSGLPGIQLGGIQRVRR